MSHLDTKHNNFQPKKTAGSPIPGKPVPGKAKYPDDGQAKKAATRNAMMQRAKG